MRSVAVLAATCFCALAITVHFGLRLGYMRGRLFHLRDWTTDQYDLVIGILSARHHHGLRDALRKTWLGHIPRLNQRVLAKFIIGTYGCDIPDDDREDPYSCQLLNFTDPVIGQEIEAVSQSGSPALMMLGSKVSKLDFRVLHPIVITRLGVFHDQRETAFHQNLTVRLYQTTLEEVIVSARFSPLSSGLQVNQMWYKPVERFLLPKALPDLLSSSSSPFIVCSGSWTQAPNDASNEADLCRDAAAALRRLPLADQVSEAFSRAEITTGDTGECGCWNLEQHTICWRNSGFEGTIAWETQDSEYLVTMNLTDVLLDSGGGVLRFSAAQLQAEKEVIQDGFGQDVAAVAGGFTYTIHDGTALLESLTTRPKRFESHKNKLREEDAALREESQTYQDIVFVDVVDTYRNVPHKLLHFYQWSVDSTNFRLLLKTDDDCYVDVEAVLERAGDRLGATNICFRQNWAVDGSGKWMELEYPSLVYPDFACGSGYVASHNLIQWLADNARTLKVYQGEDVSMGIWMAAVGPQRHQDSRWLCEKKCLPGALSSPQYSPGELLELWKNKELCGNPCYCQK